MKAVLLALSLFVGLVCFADPSKSFEAGVEALDAGDWPAAISLFEALLESGGENHAVHQNLAVAYLENNEPGPARFHAERARIHDPRAGQTLELLEEIRTIDGLPIEQSTFLESSLRAVTPNAWLILSVLFGWIWILLLATRSFSGFLKEHVGEVRFFLLVSFVCSGLSVAAFVQTQGWYDEAVITEENNVLKVAPTEQSPLGRTLIAGELVSVTQTYNDYVCVTTADGLWGWVPSQALRPLWD